MKTLYNYKPSRLYRLGTISNIEEDDHVFLLEPLINIEFKSWLQGNVQTIIMHGLTQSFNQFYLSNNRLRWLKRMDVYENHKWNRLNLGFVVA